MGAVLKGLTGERSLWLWTRQGLFCPYCTASSVRGRSVKGSKRGVLSQESIFSVQRPRPVNALGGYKTNNIFSSRPDSQLSHACLHAPVRCSICTRRVTSGFCSKHADVRYAFGYRSRVPDTGTYTPIALAENTIKRRRFPCGSSQKSKKVDTENFLETLLCKLNE